jgi:hypothetical protein
MLVRAAFAVFDRIPGVADQRISQRAVDRFWTLCSDHTVSEPLNAVTAVPGNYHSYVCLFAVHLFLIAHRCNQSTARHADKTRELLFRFFREEQRPKLKLLGVRFSSTVPLHTVV